MTFLNKHFLWIAQRWNAGFRRTILAIFIGLTVPQGRICGQTNEPAQPTNELKRLSLEELMNIEVTTVSRRPEPWFAAPSAIQVLHGEDILRSGAVLLPDALRLAPNLQVPQVDSLQWAISARGFNNTLANKLEVMIDGRTVYTRSLPAFSGRCRM